MPISVFNNNNNNKHGPIQQQQNFIDNIVLVKKQKYCRQLDKEWSEARGECCQEVVYMGGKQGGKVLKCEAYRESKTSMVHYCQLPTLF